MGDIVVYVLLFVVLLLVIALVFCVRRIAALINHIEELGQQVEESIDLLATAHDNIQKTAGKDVIENDIFVHKVVTSIFDARVAVHNVAEKLASFDKSEENRK